MKSVNVLTRIDNKIIKYILAALAGAIIAAAISTVGVLLLALLIRGTEMSSAAISIINQVLKFGSIFTGAWLSSRMAEDKGWLTGGLTGLMYVLLSLAVFSIISGSYAAPGLVWELIAGAAAGALTGMLSMAAKK